MKSITSKLSIIILSLFVSAFTYGQSDSQAFTACIAQMSQYSPPTSMYGGQDVQKMQYNMDGISTIRSCANQYQASCGTQISAWNGGPQAANDNQGPLIQYLFASLNKFRSCSNQYQASCGAQISAWNGPSNDETSQNDWVFTEMKKLRSCANQS
ncbi:MAG: hypothetical protein HOE58_04320 [Porticoccaceae bacterium]|jgi:hypothetical protein|nr:hypothetical protein [Porticoccaceae bacterium]MBT4164025.1 hypothetical protein [Porticoccaceae bacterium]MBT4591906.1 hypothetical protein [Porticoccaceae bacterium]MBT7566335.1 hypothetical protein [Porticoccaceae bacterium]MBT7751390.1 hypothetical protein [Porticoccaceae bacterium]